MTTDEKFAYIQHGKGILRIDLNYLPKEQTEFDRLTIIKNIFTQRAVQFDVEGQKELSLLFRNHIDRLEKEVGKLIVS
jgi:phosphopantothenate synthetase